MHVDALPAALLVPQSAYVLELPAHAFEPATSRIALIPMYLAVVAISTVAIASGWLPWLLAPLLSLAIGVSFAGLTFVAHEAVHGGIVRGRKARQCIG